MQSVEALLAERERKQLVRFVVVGSVDDGKSTLIGRLLYEANGLFEDQVAQARRASKQRGEEIDFSLFTDGLKAEREQAITIDVAYRYFATARRKYIIADTPGHVQYTRNMVTGASTAEVAIILIDARLGLLPQSRRHAYLASLLGIPHLAVAINKMDLVGFDLAVFERIRDEFQRFSSSLGFASVHFFPISARGGDNVVARSERTPWHAGGTILEFLESVPVGLVAASGPFRFPVQYVLRPHLDYRGFAGQVASGEVRAGDAVVVLPSGRRTRVKAIDTYEGGRASAFAPLSVVLRLEDEVDVSRGDMIVGADEAPYPTTAFEASLVWMTEKPLQPGRGYLLKHTTRSVTARVEEVGAETLGLNEIGRVRIRCLKPIVAEPYARNRATGAFVLIDALTNATVGAGMVVEPAGAGESRLGDGATRPVSAAERRRRLGHGAAVVWVAGEGERAARALAEAIERGLFDAGLTAVAVPANAESARACLRGGLVAIVAVDRAAAGAALLEELRSEGIPLIDVSVLSGEESPVQRALEALSAAGVV
ncbi:MAG TPA: GTP-binding protein [Myxococcaceae bacterium]|nr:GTP-binding protein [Myxococcaceae bacterium]